MLTPNYHKIYNLKPVYNIDKQDLKDRYFKLSKKYHPDLVALKYKSIVDGYNILKDDYKRAVYMYKGSNEMLDTQFLSKVLELEEEIESCDNKRLNEIEEYVMKCTDECKSKYNDGRSISQWRYYERLMDKIRDRMATK